MPLGISEVLFVKDYWNPVELFHFFGLMISIEDFLFCFSVGGISSVLYKIAFKKEIDYKKRYHYHRWYISLGPLVLIFFYFLNFNFMHASIIGLFVSALVILLSRKDLWKEIFFGGILFSIFYFFFLLSLSLIFPFFIPSQWRLNNLMGIFLFGIPLEEIFWALSFSMVWSGVFEYFFRFGIKDKEKNV